MINYNFYNTLATDYAETLREGCGCLVELKCTIADDLLGKHVTSVSCGVCKKQFPETMKVMNEKINKFSRGLWRE